MVTDHKHEWQFADNDLFECECGASTNFDGAKDHTGCVICKECHTCEQRALPDGECECCWLASK